MTDSDKLNKLQTFLSVATLKSIIGWFFGLLFFLIAFSSFIPPYDLLNIFVGFIALILGVLVTPPVFRAATKKLTFLTKAVRKFSIIGAVVLMIIVASVQESKLQEEIAATPQPKIELLSSSEHQGSNTSYNLTFSADNEDKAFVNGKEVTSEEGLYTANISLNTPTTDIVIKVENKHKEDELTLKITRDKTEEELESERIAEEERLKAEEDARIAAEKEAEEQARIEQEAKQALVQPEIDTIKEAIERIDNFDSEFYRGSKLALELEVSQFSDFASKIESARTFENEELKTLANSLESKLKNLQIKEFPQMRKEYAKYVDEVMWEFDIDVYAKGASNSSIELVGGYFAANKNIKTTQETLSSMLKLLRFDRANYKWYEYASNYDYYDIDSLADSEIDY